MSAVMQNSEQYCYGGFRSSIFAKKPINDFAKLYLLTKISWYEQIFKTFFLVKRKYDGLLEFFPSDKSNLNGFL